MKVLMINSHFTSGGPPRVMNGIYDILVANGHECKIAAARGDFYVEKDSIKIGGNIYINALKSRLFDSEGFNAKTATRKMIKDIKKYDPDIIHLHNLHGYYLNIEMLFTFLKKYNKPVVWTLHDMWSFSGHSAFCAFSSCEKWRKECFKCPCLKEYPRSFFDFSKRNFHKKKNLFCGLKNLTIVTPSNWLESLVKDSFLKNYNIKTIYNGINLSKFHTTNNEFRKKHNLGNKKILLGVAAVWNDRKGFKDFLKLSHLVDNNTFIVLVGLNENQIKETPSNVIGIKKTESVEELIDIYSSSDIFVNLTYADNFPTTNIESLACGTPVITYKTGGSGESIDEACGWVVNKGDINAVLNIINSFNKTEQMANECLIQSKKYSANVRYLEYIELYKLIGGGVNL